MKQIITIDFDGTLSKPEIQGYVKDLIQQDIQIFILTSRFDELHKHLFRLNPTLDDLYTVTDSLGIPHKNIFFTNMDSKHNFLEKTKVIAHLDDDDTELWSINEYTNTAGVSVNSNYQKIINTLLGL